MSNAKRIVTLGAVIWGLALAAQAAVAPTVGDKMFFSDLKNGQRGGSFQVNPTAGSTFDVFKSFCVELEQHIYVSNNGNPNFQYEVDSISTQTESTGRSLTSMAAWLYKSFVDGTIADYDDTVKADRNALQAAIWRAMGYSDADMLSELGGGYQNVLNDLATRPWAADYAASGFTGIGQVRVMNLVWGNSHKGNGPGTEAQDQLVITPVPVPAAAMLGTLGLGIVGAIRRRFA